MRLRLSASTFARITYYVVVLAIAFLLLISCLFLLSQAVRTAPSREWAENGNALVIGASYIFVLVLSLLLCLKRRLSMRLQLMRIPKSRVAIGKGDLPKAVHVFIEEELIRSCAIAYASQPEVSHRDGWGTPGTKYENVRFRTAILDVVPIVDSAARAVIPSMPLLSPHVSFTRHLRHIAPLISADTHGEAYFRTFTDAVEKARYADREMSQSDFEAALEAGTAIAKILTAYQQALNERTFTRVRGNILPQFKDMMRRLTNIMYRGAISVSRNPLEMSEGTLSGIHITLG